MTMYIVQNFKITRRTYWRRASITTAKRSQAPGDATVLKRFFRDNFVIFRRRSKRIAFLESVIFSTCVYMQIFNFRDGQVTTFRYPSGAYICQMPGRSVCVASDERFIHFTL